MPDERGTAALRVDLIVILEQQAALHPTRPAVIWRGGETSFGGLMDRVKRVSQWLVDRGVVAETPVGVCADRSLAWIVGALAVLRAGGVYVPLDPMAPLRRKARMVEDAGARLVLVEPHLRALLPASIEVAVLDADWPTTISEGTRPSISQGQAAYGIYTSGSTGIPKNVVVSHDALANYALTLRREFGLEGTDRYLHTASLAFSASIRQLVAPLASGATVVLATREEVRDPRSLASWMAKAGVTVFDTIPSYLARWLAGISETHGDWRERLAGSLRLVLTTGEPLQASTAQSLHDVLPGARLLNLYGQTETTGTVALHETKSTGGGVIPIGRALGPCQFYVLDEHLEPAPDGELYISGLCLARGYEGQPEATAVRFLPDPFSMIPGARMYRTGDLVRRIDNGLLEFRGRADSQVKVHGVRIELGEIDTTLLEHPGVLAAATVLRPMPGSEPRLVSFVVPSSRTRCPSGESLRSLLGTILPEAMIPALVVVVDELPRTPGGKTDRPALLAWDLTPPVPTTSSVPPRSRLERLVAACWEEVLQVTGIGADSDFFDLGGDSMQAINMTLRLQKLLPVQLPLGALFFQDPSVKAFANAIELEIGEEGPAAPPLEEPPL